MAAGTRKYHVQHFDDGKVVRERIIEATNQATARAYASNTTIAVELLTPDAALRLGAAGISAEKGVAPKTKVLHPEQQELFAAAVPEGVANGAQPDPGADPEGGAA